MSIPEPKGEHHKGRGIRSCPIFPELRLILDEAFEIFGSESEYVVAHPGFRAAANTPDGLEELEPQNRAYATPAPRRRVTLATTIPLGEASRGGEPVGKRSCSASFPSTWFALGLAIHRKLRSRATCWLPRTILPGRLG